MNIIESNLDVCRAFAIKNCWIVSCYHDEYIMGFGKKQSYFKLFPDGNKSECNSGYVILSWWQSKLTLRQNGVEEKSLDENGEITNQNNAFVVKQNEKYKFSYLPDDEVLLKWAGIKEDEIGVVFLNSETNKSVMLGIPKIFTKNTDYDYNHKDYDFVAIFSLDEQTILLLENGCKKVIILDNPVHE